MTDAVMQTIDKFNNGDDVTIESIKENGSDFITSLIAGTATQAESIIAPSLQDTPAEQTVSTGSTYKEGNSFKEPFLPKDEWIAKMKKEGKWKGGSSMEKSPEVQNSIKRQAIGHMTSRTLIGMQGIVTPDNVIELIDKLYAKYVEIVG